MSYLWKEISGDLLLEFFVLPHKKQLGICSKYDKLITTDLFLKSLNYGVYVVQNRQYFLLKCNLYIWRIMCLKKQKNII